MNDSQAEGQPPKVVTVEISSDPVVSFASYQNSIPVVHSVTLQNNTDSDLTEVEVILDCEPAFAAPLRHRYEILRAGESRMIRPVVLRSEHRFLAELTEAERGRIHCRILSKGEMVGEVDAPITVLAFDQWGGTQTVAELLAAFCCPNNPHIDRLLADAGELLRRDGADATLNGYTSKNREIVWAQIAAIYAAIARRHLEYSLPPASFASDGQKVRMPDRVLTAGVATCVDLTLLMAACMEQAGLNPLIFIKDGHAFVGCWLINTSMATCLIDDVQALRKRIDAGELIAIETTHLTQNAGHSLRRAMEAGDQHLRVDEHEFRYAIDIRRARLERITPLPTREVAALERRDVAEAAVIVERPPVLPPLLGQPILIDEDPVVETPEGRLSRWKAKLLDLTLRNRLLNFKANRLTIPIEVADISHLEDTLSDGKEWKFKPMPPLMEGSDPRSRSLFQAREGEDPIKGLVAAAMERHELLVRLDASKMDKSLYELFLAVRTGLEETGANTLFLAMGFLRWAEDERAEKTYLAPLLLVPVTLTRESVRTGFSIKRHDDETIVNPTLLQALKDKHGLTIRGLEPLPYDSSGVDVKAILGIFHHAVKDIPRWEVVPDTYLGVFSFHKFLMYTDLKSRQEDLRKSRVVSHLMDRPGESMGSEDIRRCDDIDETHAPGELLSPMSADSSQLNALRRASQGHDFVLKGPPGTGKSQTITNLISDALARGKRVLFVSEKMAALSVVERRLKEVGLGPFCLQLHSAKAKKTEVLTQLANTLALTKHGEPKNWQIEVERLTRLRGELNGLVQALHAEYPNGLTVRDALDTAIKHREWEAAPIALRDDAQLDQRGLESMRDLARQLQAVAVELGDVNGHPLSPLRQTSWANAWEAQLLQAGKELHEACKLTRATAQAIEQPFRLTLAKAGAKTLSDFDRLAAVLLAAPALPSGLAEAPDDAKLRSTAAGVRRAGQARINAWNNLAGALKPECARLNGVELEDAWSIAATKWALPRWFAQRAVRTRLIPYTLDGKRPAADLMSTLLQGLRDLNAADEAVHARESQATETLGEHYQGDQTDWAAVERAEIWCATLSQALDRFASIENPTQRTELAGRVRLMAAKASVLLAPDGEIARRLLAFREAHAKLNAAMGAVDSLTGNAEFANRHSSRADWFDQMALEIKAWFTYKAQIKAWCLWNGLRLRAATFGLSGALTQIDQGAVPASKIADYFEYCYQSWWLKLAMDRDEVLTTFSGAVHGQKIRDFRAADERFQQLTRELIVARLCAAIPNSAMGHRPSAEMAVLTREIAKQRAHIPIRKLVQATPTLLPTLKPCLLMSPLSVAQYLDPAVPQFDLAVFDEASQIPVWDAVGAIARGKQAIVVGDPKQLPPTAFFDGAEDEEAIVGEVEGAPPQDLESILNECMASGMSMLSLDWHYRSAHESLIAFSNQRYYESRLITFPSPVTHDTAVKLVPVQGIYDRGASQTNRIEAEAIVARIVEHFGSVDPKVRKKTMGVVTFNAKQMRLIDELLNQAIGKDPELEAQIATHGDERLFIKNLENVQGDERDIILFSITFGKDALGRTSMNFGPLNQQGGERRLNVAVTRARQAVEIYSSLRPEDIDLARTRAGGVADLKAYLEYAIRGPSALAMEAAPTGRDPDSPFEVDVINVLREAGHVVHPQVGCSGYRIDIGVVDRGSPGRYIIGVECDGATYHAMPSARDRDRLRQSVLEGLGWTMTRVWSTDWWSDRDAAKKVLLAAVDAAQAKADEEARRS